MPSSSLLAKYNICARVAVRMAENTIVSEDLELTDNETNDPTFLEKLEAARAQARAESLRARRVRELGIYRSIAAARHEIDAELAIKLAPIQKENAENAALRKNDRAKIEAEEMSIAAEKGEVSARAFSIEIDKVRVIESMRAQIAELLGAADANDQEITKLELEIERLRSNLSPEGTSLLNDRELYEAWKLMSEAHEQIPTADIERRQTSSLDISKFMKTLPVRVKAWIQTLQREARNTRNTEEVQLRKADAERLRAQLRAIPLSQSVELAREAADSFASTSRTQRVTTLLTSAQVAAKSAVQAALSEQDDPLDLDSVFDQLVQGETQTHSTATSDDSALPPDLQVAKISTLEGFELPTTDNFVPETTLVTPVPEVNQVPSAVRPTFPPFPPLPRKPKA